MKAFRVPTRNVVCPDTLFLAPFHPFCDSRFAGYTKLRESGSEMKSPKKSETLEVRLSHPDKVALQDKAAREGRSVSAVVRGLISSYLAQGEPRSQPSRLTELLMTLKRKPKSIAATLACVPILGLLFLLPASASAEDISLSLKGEYIAAVVENGEEGTRTRRFNTELQITPGHFMTMRLPSLIAQGPKSGLYMVVQVQEQETDIILGLTLCEVADAPQKHQNVVEMIPINVCETANIIAKPTLTTQFGDRVEFKMGDSAGETFSFSALPKRL